MDWERRALYRTRPSLGVSVAVGVGALAAGRLENLTAAGARVAFASVPVNLVQGARVQILFESERLRAPVLLGGVVKYTSPEAVGVAFEIPESAPSEVFNRRSAFRAAPRKRDGEAIVNLRSDRRSCGRGRLLDISTGGVAVAVGPEVAEAVTNPVDLQIFLPDNSIGISIRGEICERKLIGSEFRLGIVLRPEGEEGLSTQRIIYDFVVRRQRDLIRQLMNVMSAEPERHLRG